MTTFRDDLREIGHDLWPDDSTLRPRAVSTVRKRRWALRSKAALAGLATAIVIFAGIAAGTVVLVARQHASEPSGVPSVPWLSMPATGNAAAPFTIAGVGPCVARDLSVSINVADPSYVGRGPANTSFWTVSVRDTSARACFVNSTFDATFLTSSGSLSLSRQVLPAADIIYLYPASQPPPAGFSSQANGEVGSVGCALPPIRTILWSPGPGLGTLAISPGPAGGSGIPCSGGHQYYAELCCASPIASPALVQTSLTGPATASPGEHYRFTVTVRNAPVPRSCVACPTPAPSISFAPCPTYHEELEGTADSFQGYVLNCHAAASIAAGDAETFDMVIDVPADASPGRSVLRWAVDGSGSLFEIARMYLTIVPTAANTSPQASTPSG